MPVSKYLFLVRAAELALDVDGRLPVTLDWLLRRSENPEFLISSAVSVRLCRPVTGRERVALFVGVN